MSVHIQRVEPVPYLGVIDKDIAAATSHGVAAGLKRHLEMKNRYPHQFTHNYRRIIAGTALRLLWNIENFDASSEMIRLLNQLYNQEFTLEELLGEGIASPFALIEKAQN